MKFSQLPAMAPAQLIAGLKEVANSVREIERERTEQLRIREAARIDVEKIHGIRDLLMQYLDRSFDERSENFRKLFERLDVAIEQRDAQLAAQVLTTVTQLAESSPFRELQDVASARAAMNDKKTEWEF